MDRKFNDFNKFNHDRRRPSRGAPDRDDFMGRKFDKFNGFGRERPRSSVDEARGRMRMNNNGFRDKSRASMAGFRENLEKDKSEESVHETEAVRDGSDDDNYTEKFHERQVDYRKNVHTNKSDDDLRGERDDLRRDRDVYRKREVPRVRELPHGRDGGSFRGDSRGKGL
jgi:E3 ubiquitin-protein ligase DOA10